MKQLWRILSTEKILHNLCSRTFALSAAFSGKEDPKKAVEVVGNAFSASSKCIFHMAGI